MKTSNLQLLTGITYIADEFQMFHNAVYDVVHTLYTCITQQVTNMEVIMRKLQSKLTHMHNLSIFLQTVTFIVKQTVMHISN